MNLGDMISSAFTGAPVEREAAFAEGLLRSAQTDSAISQARERRATAQAKERENNRILTLADDLIAADPNMDPAVARTIAAGASAGLGNFQQLAAGRNAIESGARLRSIADPNTTMPDRANLRAAEAPGSYQQQRVQGGMLLDDATMDPTVTPVGQAQIDNYHETAANSKPGAGQFTVGGVRYNPDGTPVIDPSKFGANAAAAAAPVMDAKNIAKLKADMPKAKAALRETENEYKEVNQLVNAAAQDPNLWQTAGLAQPLSKVPGTEGVRLRSLLATLKYRLGFSVLQNMRQLSPTGGALGNVSNAEGEWLQNAIVPLNMDMSVGDLREVLNSLNQFTANAGARRRQAYNEQFAGIDPDVQVAAPPAPAPGAPAPLTPPRPAVEPLAPQPRVFNLPPVNNKGWRLMKDADGNHAYVNPQNPAEFEEVQ